MQRKKAQRQLPKSEAKDEARIPLTAEEIAELKNLLKQIERVVHVINMPIATGAFLFTTSTVLPRIPYLRSSLIFMVTKIKSAKEDNSEIVLAAAILMAIAIIYSIYKLENIISKRIQKLFPKGWLGLEPFANEPEHWQQAKKLLSGQQVDAQTANIIKQLKQDLDNNLMPKANALMALIVAIDLLSRIFSFNIPKSDNFYGVAIRQLYESRHYVRNFWDRKKYRELVGKQITKLNKLCVCDGWEVVEDKKIDDKDKRYHQAIFKLRLDSDKTVTIPEIKDVNETAFNVRTAHYLSDMAAVLKKAGVKVLAEGHRVLTIGNEAISDKKINQLRRELILRLKRRREIQDNLNKKMTQLTQLVSAINGNANWHPLPKRDANDFETLEFAIVSNVVAEKFKADFLHHLATLYGNESVREENGSIFVRGHLPCSQEKFAASIAALQELVLRNKPVEISALSTALRVDSKSSDTFTPVEKRKHKNTNSAAHEEKKSDSKLDTTTQLVKMLKLKESEEIFPLQVPWAPGKNLYYAVIDSTEFKNHLGEDTFKIFRGYFAEGRVHGYGGQGVGLFPCDKQYENFNSKSEISEFQAKNKRNIRLFGKVQSEMIVNGEKRKIVRMDGYTLRAH